MGQDINRIVFKKKDFNFFERQLRAETEYLRKLFKEKAFAKKQKKIGLEIELWLVDRDLNPVPINEVFLKKMDSDLAFPELAEYNVEINTVPRFLEGDVFRKAKIDVKKTLNKCYYTAKTLDIKIISIGTLPTVKEAHLTIENVTPRPRYKALNQQILRLRQGHPVQLNIMGKENLRTSFHQSVMLEAATTSLQIHTRIPQSEAARYYNAIQILSAPMVALTANSPYLFGKDLYDETRIPLFEQSLHVYGQEDHYRLVTMGYEYIKDSLMEFFDENLYHYNVLLPIDLDPDISKLTHLRFHNGVIWKWNRAVIGFDNDGGPHLRIEHRVIPSGPSISDIIANLAFFSGVLDTYARGEIPPESQIPFHTMKDNFYNAARDGMKAKVTWTNGVRGSVHTLLTEVLLPQARKGLERLEIDKEDMDFYLNIIKERLARKRNGANWQRLYVAKYGKDMQRLTEAYLERQLKGMPVHEWKL
jgi:gamma-glutamyl:cysteine ligase YbdK (ATP-grasp superfamily)